MALGWTVPTGRIGTGGCATGGAIGRGAGDCSTDGALIRGAGDCATSGCCGLPAGAAGGGVGEAGNTRINANFRKIILLLLDRIKD